MDRTRTEAMIPISFAGERPWIDTGAQPYTLKADTESVLLEMAGTDFCQIIQDRPLVIMSLCGIYSCQIRADHHSLLGKPIETMLRP